ncbi:RDD family protein [Grimontia kaedaensis]|uniref:RDD family protein n=1 Tax=Grimontia kaedaensis TaxID=2872157 RepID=A0ABY4WP53_9GAMM|nr:RDD family protein [Grimontia kaedaensis]USH01373.1 RDD family protein [Grimontia kaedaensis]
MGKAQETWICGFWRRIGALCADFLFLAIVGNLLGITQKDFLAQLGGWGLLVGFAISIIYFGVMNSSLVNGQTLGKMLLKIRVVDSSNSTVSLPMSFLRSSIVLIPVFLSVAQLPSEVLLPYLIYPLSFIILGGFLSILYLYIFNRVTRQSLHDLVSGTYVVSVNGSIGTPLSIWKPHLVIVTLVLITSFLSPIFTSDLVKSKDFISLLETEREIRKNKLVKSATVQEVSSTFNSFDSSSKTIKFVEANVFLHKKGVYDANIAKRLAAIIVDVYPDSLNNSFIQVTLTYGYDIGISSRWYSNVYRFSPKDLTRLK